MSANPGIPCVPEPTPFPGSRRKDHGVGDDARSTTHGTVTPIDQAGHRGSRYLSRWSRSARKRIFDVASVLLTLPVILPVFLAIGLAVRLTSCGPVLFRQQRMGRNGRIFTILKFRTMPIDCKTVKRPAVTTSVNQRFTPVGPFLRRWKLDELPQLINVIRGDMSIVGPRPKLPQHQAAYLHCRPGLTGGATIVFAREEVALSSVPTNHLENYYHSVVIPAKQQLDDEYMARSTFASDFKLILRSIFRHWDENVLTDLPPLDSFVALAASQRKMSEDWAAKTHSAVVSLPAPKVAVPSPWQRN